ncbi:disease resistance rpp13-like protein 3 [Hordeum vulgare]|nr:disease resistance rpp13-like protein 3 [Hordeum vulgare]
MEEEGLVSAATGALQPVLAKLAALLGDEYKEVRGEVELLTRELAAMDAFLLTKSEEEEDHSSQDKACMHEIRELSYDIDDDLGGFIMASVPDKSAELAGLLDKMQAMLGRTKARHQMIATAVDDLKEQVVKVAERHSHHKRPKVDDGRALATVNNASSELVGIDGPKEELIQLLTGSDSESRQQQPNPSLVAIVGSGGMGKTTLAKQVYKDLKQSQFNCHAAFCSVPRSPDKVQVISAIYKKLNRSYYPSPDEDLPHLVTMISDFLQDKQYGFNIFLNHYSLVLPSSRFRRHG